VVNVEPDSLPAVEEMLESLENGIEEHKLLDDKGLATVKQNLRRLTEPGIRDVVQRLRKASELITATGNDITGLNFICDARPVYNDDRTDIDGFLPLATMKLFYDDPNGDQQVIEITMKPDDLDSFIDLATKAREKLNVMRKKFSALVPDAVRREQT
jgi:hypothetical protein